MRNSIIKFCGFLFFIIPCVLKINAQEQLEHKKKYYVREDGRFFINKALPVYLRLSVSPEPNAESHLLKSETSPKITNPFYFDTEGYNTIRTPWKVDPETREVIVPREDIIFEVYTDSKSPVSKLEFNEKSTYKRDGKQFYSGNLKISIAAKDKISGVEKSYYSIDGEAFKEYTQPLELSQEKSYTLKYYSVDHVGNAEEIKTYIFGIDQTPPKTNHNINGNKIENILSPYATIELTAVDEVSEILETNYSIDDGKEHQYTSPIKLVYLKEGVHSITYYSVDNVTNTEKKTTYEFFIDRTAPTVIKEVLGDKFLANGRQYSSGRSKVKLTAVDNKAGVKEVYYKIGNEDATLYEQPFYLPNQSGTVRVDYYAIDNVGNNSKGANRNAMNIGTDLTFLDLTGPELHHSLHGAKFVLLDTIYISAQTKIRLNAMDNESGVSKIGYTIDDKPENEYNEPFTITNEGKRLIQYTGYDNVNNTNSETFYVVVDKTGPTIYERFSIPPMKNATDSSNETYPSHVILFLSATDRTVGCNKMYYAINKGAFRPYAAMISGFKPGNTYTIHIKAIDKLGNETIKDVVFSIR